MLIQPTATCHQLNWPQLGSALSALITPIVALIATYIAVQQFVINRRQYRLALFEKRMTVFNSTMTMLASVMQTANPTLNQCFQFIQDTRDHEFLFGPEIGKFIDDVYRKAVELHTHVAVGGASAPAQQTLLMTWFGEQMKEARRVFLKYLDF